MAKALKNTKSSSKVIEGDVILSLKGVELDKLSFKLPAPEKIRELSSDEAEKNIGTIRSAGMKAKILAHTTACGILKHYETTGDYSKLIRLHAAVGEAFGASMATKLATWVSQYSTVKWNAKGVEDAKGVNQGGNYFDSVKGEGMDAKKFHLSYINDEGQQDGAAHIPFWNVTSTAGGARLYYEMELVSNIFVRLSNLLAAKKKDNVKHTVSDKFLEDFRNFLTDHGFTFTSDGKPVVPKPTALPYYKEEKKTTLIKARGSKKADGKPTRSARRPRKAPPAEPTASETSVTH